MSRAAPVHFVSVSTEGLLHCVLCPVGFMGCQEFSQRVLYLCLSEAACFRESCMGSDGVGDALCAEPLH